MITILNLLVSSGLAFAVGTSEISKVEYREYDFNGVDKISITNGAGRIAILPMSVNKIEITVSKRQFDDTCSLHIAKEMGVNVVIKVEQPTGAICKVDFDVRVPQDINLDINSGSGDVTVAGVKGNLNFNLGSGSLKATGEFKRLEGKAGSGDVDVRGLKGVVDVNVGSGQAKLGFVADPKGLVAVKAGSGDATLMFPKGTKIKSALSTGSGEVTNDFDNSPRADIEVKASSGSGDVNVKTY